MVIELLRLMIAEDEALERKALKFILSKFYKDSIEIVCEASNGKDAVDMAIKFQPDIILMDINMPIIDGLEAGSIIKSKCKSAEFIILTAFNYFDYAKKAIGIGVSDYLLKPFSNKDFCDAIDKLSNKINLKNSEEIKNQELSEKYKKAMPFVEKEIITNIVYGLMLTDDEFNEYRKMLNISSNRYCCIVFNCNNKNLLNEEMVQKIQVKLKSLFSDVIGAICLNDIVIFVFDDELEQKILGHKLKKTIFRIHEDVKSEKKIDIYSGIGSMNKKASELYISYRQARLSLQKEKNLAKQNIDENHNYILSNVEFNDVNLNDKVSVIFANITNEDLECTLFEVDNLLEYFLISNEKDKIAIIVRVLSDILGKIIDNAVEFMEEEPKEVDKKSVLEELEKLKQVTEIKCYVHMVIKTLIKQISKFKKNKNIDVVEKVKKYIGQNYMREINLDELSQQVYMSSFYLSRVFRKVEGMNIRDYLIKLRMEKAKSMLREEGKSIKQIGIEVGYPDQNYFSRAFKKHTNLSPKEYSNL